MLPEDMERRKANKLCKNGKMPCFDGDFWPQEAEELARERETKRQKAKKEAAPGEKPRGIKTHLRNMIIVPEMIGSIVGIYNGKMFCGVEMKPEMVGMYLGEFAITYKPVRHGRPGVSAAHQTRFIPL